MPQSPFRSLIKETAAYTFLATLYKYETNLNVDRLELKWTRAVGKKAANSTVPILFMSSYEPPIAPNYAADAKTLIAHRTHTNAPLKTIYSNNYTLKNQPYSHNYWF